MTTKLRKLTKISKLKDKHEIDNLMLKFQLQDEENVLLAYDKQSQSEENTLPPNHHVTGVFGRPPLTPLEASSPMYQPKNQEVHLRSLPDISSFRNIQSQRNQQCNTNS